MSVQLAALWSCKLHLPHLTMIGYRLSGTVDEWKCRCNLPPGGGKLHLPHLPIPIGYRLSGIGPMSGKVGATCSSLELQVAPPAFTDTDEWASRFRFPPRFRFRIVLQNRPVRTEPRTSSPGSRTPLTMGMLSDRLLEINRAGNKIKTGNAVKT